MSIENLKNYLAQNDLPCGEAVLTAFSSYAKQLAEYNEKVNLTAITDTGGIYLKHFLDSILGQELIPANSSVVDVGTGAGFPGVPIKIVRPDINLTLLDSLNKRVVFLKQLLASPEIGLNARCFHSRAEDFNEKNSFDAAVARAVAKLPDLIKYCFPLLKHGGRLIAYKSENIDGELASARNSADKLCVKDIEIYEKQLCADIKRKLIVVYKK